VLVQFSTIKLSNLSQQPVGNEFSLSPPPKDMVIPNAQQDEEENGFNVTLIAKNNANTQLLMEFAPAIKQIIKKL